jgi:hypothetical protein
MEACGFWSPVAAIYRSVVHGVGSANDVVANGVACADAASLVCCTRDRIGSGTTGLQRQCELLGRLREGESGKRCRRLGAFDGLSVARVNGARGDWRKEAR